jgi:N-methylhydantoinase A
MTIILGIDVGGTFTDFIAYNAEDGSIKGWKWFSNSEDQGDGIIKGLMQYDKLHDITVARIGTTIATNTILERNGARVAYLATEGFEDVPWIQRGNRKENFNAQWIKPAPLVLHQDCIGVPERISSEGEIQRPLDETRLREIARNLSFQGKIESVAINFLFSYRWPIHEDRAKQIFEEELPDMPVSISFDVLPKWKEYERASTTIADAYVKPVIQQRLPLMEQQIKKLAPHAEIVIVKSNGGLSSVQGACENPVELLLSGPSGGVIATQYIARLMNEPDVITFDMGGTSTDCALCYQGEFELTTNFEVEWGLPVQVPMIDVRTLGAGGGSIVWIDNGGLLRVGPRSAGSMPGPVCYGRGGEEPTVTDANVVLGRIDPGNFLGGSVKLDVDRARNAIAQIGKKIGMSVEETAKAIIDIVNNHIVGALRTIAVEKGRDPRKFTLMGFGGAGPAHTADLIELLGIKRGIVPIFPGQFSAFGFTAADARIDRQRTVLITSHHADPEYLNNVLNRLISESLTPLKALGIEQDIVIKCSLDMRYLGQNYELSLPIEQRIFDEDGMLRLWEAFHEVFHTRYGFNQKGQKIEIVNMNVTAIYGSKKPQLKVLPHSSFPPVPVSKRQVWFHQDWVLAPIYKRTHLHEGHTILGPAVIEEDVSVALVNPGQVAKVDSYGNIVITLKGEMRP